MNITNAGVRGHNPTGVVIHNDAGSNGANAGFYNNWLPTHNPENGFAHVYIGNDGRLQASDFSNMAWHCANSYGNANYASWEVCQSEGDLNQFLRNEQAVLDDVAKYMKQWGLTPNHDTVKLHQELSSTSCPRRSVEAHGGTVESCRSYFIAELNKRLTGQNKEKGKKKMILFNTVDTKRAYISDGVTIRWIKTVRLLRTFQKVADVTDLVYQQELDDEFGKANTSK
ncbi:lysin [Lactococcus phage ASCC465]|uniref:Lysin n=10 Tax=Skunavirus TaxID=1623305 RepID=H9EEP4_9CAUD|nr:endolysin [Lactococcus phage ASCC465]YP_006201954.1 endolysin [Lactococcus phage ASCC281]AFE86646.1 lysin [Lactococcus phage ASCC473]AFE86931.1 lysin [Lactococcus phage ASCC284]AFE87046.1 lysin [Lactococcus phage ASCC310]AFE87217.1 lysin [Lactococcus phage ASCC356]AFE87271.1 lysin [Lactococcus phage ASCC358]AFE87328.1 lysin [Lactococcus phage ASCC365]AFE87795.1 lysin [Lactococcus phage ASCC497]AFE88025.1 lysin [Lactococcus phage ASCC531]